jgi:glycosyltransferase involved in cell wall biosynthesis
MKILMLAPEPFFQPRGTPISVYFRSSAISELGHDIDLVTYPLGEDVTLPNLRILRIPNFLGLKKIKIGPSLAKIPLDAALTLRAAWRLLGNRYDLILSHEEAALPGVLLGRLGRVPHLYDMHSSLPQQLENFEFTKSRVLKSLFARMERFILRNSRSVIVICPDLLDKVKAEGFGSKSILIENVVDFPAPEVTADDLARKRRALAPGGEPIVLYAGNFGPYQGVQLVVEAAARIKTAAVFVLLGGSPADQAELKEKARGLGVESRIVFLDRVPPSEVPLFVKLADVLVSPRLTGTNTPLKIYSFLKSGKPLVATRLYTHTQVLNDVISILVEPTADGMAEGITFALTDPGAKRRAAAARELADREFTAQAYREKVGQALAKAVERSRS